MTEKKVYIHLANGKVFQGYSFGAEGTAAGEVVFTTSAAGFSDTLNDQSNKGKIVVQTFPLVGNYGIITQDGRGDTPALSAYVVREYCEKPSNFRCQTDLDSYMKDNGVIGVYGVDTRELTRTIRENGVMDGVISPSPKPDPALFKKIPQDAVTKTGKEVCSYGNPGDKKIALWNFGDKFNLVEQLLGRGCFVIEVPPEATAGQILELGVRGVVLSNGAGDPGSFASAVKNIKKLSGKLPVLGIGLGHLLFALAADSKVFKMKCGHRGGNLAVRYLCGDRIYTTTQNHGYEVSPDCMTAGQIVFSNVTDGTVEGIEYKELSAVTVQFFPQTDGGPQDTSFVYDKFLAWTEV